MSGLEPIPVEHQGLLRSVCVEGKGVISMCLQKGVCDGLCVCAGLERLCYEVSSYMEKGVGDYRCA